MRHSASRFYPRFSPRFSFVSTAAAIAALMGVAALPAQAESIATSASSAGSVSSRQLSDSIGQSSDSSSKDRKVAKRRETDIVQRLWSSEFAWKVRTAPTFREWAERYQRAYTVRKRAPWRDRQILAHALPALGAMRLDQVTRSACQEYLARRAATEGLLLRRLLELQLDALEEQLGLAETYPAYMFRRFGDPAGVHWQSAAYELHEFIRQCREHEVPVAIALFPHLSPGLSAGAYEFTELYDQVLALCRDEAVPCVDLRATFAPYRDYTSLWVHRFDAHPNARAHRLTGERIAEALGPVWLEAGRSGGRTTLAAPRTSPR